MYIKAVPSVHDRKIHGIHGLISSLLSVGRLIWAHCRHNPPREQGIHPPLPLYRLLRPSPIICQLPPVHGTGHSCPDCAHGLISFSHFLPSWTTPSPQGLLSRCYWHLVCRCKWALVYVILHLLPFLRQLESCALQRLGFKGGYYYFFCCWKERWRGLIMVVC